MGGIHAAAALFGLGKFLLLLALPLWFFVKSSVSSLFQRLPAPKGLELRREQPSANATTLMRSARCMPITAR